jgi:hypothetical protein
MASVEPSEEVPVSILDYLFDHDWRQRADIERLKAEQAHRRRQEARSSLRSGRRLDDLEARVGELTLLCRALAVVLRETAVVDPDVLAETMQRLDAEDGVADGRVTPGTDRPAAREAPRPGRRRKR